VVSILRRACAGDPGVPVEWGWQVSDIATCAKCGHRKELCESVRIDDIKQPRICKDCLIDQMKNGYQPINTLYWVMQIGELDDKKTIAALAKAKGGG
jgi:hypothetical protein